MQLSSIDVVYFPNLLYVVVWDDNVLIMSLVFVRVKWSIHISDFCCLPGEQNQYFFWVVPVAGHPIFALFSIFSLSLQNQVVYFWSLNQA